MARLKKNSPQAKAWAKKMLLARMKKASIRTAGRIVEKKFFGPKGIFAMAGHVKHLEKNPKKKTSLLIEQRKYSGGVSVSIYQKGQRFTVVVDDASKHSLQYRNQVHGVYNSREKAIQLVNFIEETQLSHLTRTNPGAAWHEGLANAAEEYGRRAPDKLEKVLAKGMEVAHRDSARAARRLKMNTARERHISTLAGKKVRSNPLAVFGVANPPKRISTGIAGVVYGRCIEIRAEKLKYQPGYYKHPFSRKAGVQILALDNGDLLVHSTRGVNLWEPI